MARTLNEFKMALDIFMKHLTHGPDAVGFISAEHDIIYAHVSVDQIPEESDSGKKLIEFGWHVEDEDGWAYYT